MFHFYSTKTICAYSLNDKQDSKQAREISKRSPFLASEVGYILDLRKGNISKYKKKHYIRQIYFNLISLYLLINGFQTIFQNPELLDTDAFDDDEDEGPTAGKEETPGSPEEAELENEGSPENMEDSPKEGGEKEAEEAKEEPKEEVKVEKPPKEPTPPQNKTQDSSSGKRTFKKKIVIAMHCYQLIESFEIVLFEKGPKLYLF